MVTASYRTVDNITARILALITHLSHADFPSFTCTHVGVCLYLALWSLTTCADLRIHYSKDIEQLNPLCCSFLLTLSPSLHP